MSKCKWSYCPGANRKQHFAIAGRNDGCKRRVVYLSRYYEDGNVTPEDLSWYNGRLCNVCGREIELKIDLFEDDEDEQV